MFRRAIKRPRVPLHEDDEIDPRSGLGREESSICEHDLEKLVFGDAENLIDKFQTSLDKSVKEELSDDSDESDESYSDKHGGEESKLKTRRSERADHEKTNKKSKKKKAERDSSDDEDDITRQADDYLMDKSGILGQGFINIKRVRDLNYSSKNEGSILKSVEFHPSATVALVAGKAGIATLFQVDGETNPKIQSIKFKKFPISTAHFTADGQQVVVGSSEQRIFYYYDMIAGKICEVPWDKGLKNKNMGEFTVSPDNNILAFHGLYGQIHLLTAKSKEWIGSLKINSNVKALAFNKDGSRLYVHGSGGEVFIFDMTTRDCIHKFFDDGCIHGTAICVSSDSNRIICGSDSGVVNIYDASKIWTASPKPSKIFLNLTTPISNVRVNHSNELMVMASDIKDNAIKLAHLQSMTVFSNFPFNRINMKRPISIDLSLNSGYLAIGNNFGSVFLYRLKHYENF